jgi:hypothetical protein
VACRRAGRGRPGRGGELADQEGLLGQQAAGPFGVVPLLGLGQILVEGGGAGTGRAGGGHGLDQVESGQLVAGAAGIETEPAARKRSPAQNDLPLLARIPLSGGRSRWPYGWIGAVPLA